LGGLGKNGIGLKTFSLTVVSEDIAVLRRALLVAFLVFGFVGATMAQVPRDKAADDARAVEAKKADSSKKADDSTAAVISLLAVAAVLIFVVILMVVFFSFVRLWVQCFLTGAQIGILDLVGMKLRNVEYAMIARQKIALVRANVKISTRELEDHYLARGNVPKTATAVIAAQKAGMDLPWRVAAAIDLAGRDILDAVKTSVNPKVIDCPDPGKGRPTLDGVCKNGIQLKARARVTVRTKLDRLVGGATEETIIARVGEGI